jgi:hypothetical protein
MAPIKCMYAATFAFTTANKHETVGNVEGNDVILTEVSGCPLHVLGPNVGVVTARVRFVFGDPEFKSSLRPISLTDFFRSFSHSSKGKFGNSTSNQPRSLRSKRFPDHFPYHPIILSC